MGDAKISIYHKAIYGKWTGNPKGSPCKPDRCAEVVWGDWFSHQCNRKRGFGPEQAFCQQHAKKYK